MIGGRSEFWAVQRRFALLVALLASAGCGVVPVGKSVEVPVGVPSRMSAEQVEAIVRDMVAANATSLGRELRPFRVTRITLVAANGKYEVTNADGTSTGAWFSEPSPFWAVEVEGTFQHCDAICSGYSQGVVIIDDASGELRGEGAREPTRPSP
jgi:hypothetical protein